MKPFLPLGQVTGIGSLPHYDPEEAVAFVGQFSPVIPFWPQLPQRSPAEEMIGQMLSPVLDLVDKHGPAHFVIKNHRLQEFQQRLREAEAALRESHAAGFFAFERACQSERFCHAVALKGQVTGPATLGWCLYYEGRPLVRRLEVYADLIGYVQRLAAWQIARLKVFGQPVILFIDEPMVAYKSLPSFVAQSLAALIARIRQEEAYVGIHCCAVPAPASLCTLRPDILSFDAHQGLEEFLVEPETHAFVKAGGSLAYGMVPTSNDVEHFNSFEAFVRWVYAARDLGDVPAVAARSLITATCGLGLCKVEIARAAFDKAMQLSHFFAKAASEEADLHLTLRGRQGGSTPAAIVSNWPQPAEEAPHA